ncbi:MAG: hypothetical protein ACFB20_11770 [Opitutales bacterium]
MSIQPDDPRLTAYALGALDDPAAREAVEAAVRSDAELQRAVEAIQHTAEQLQEALAGEAGPVFSPAEKAALAVAGSSMADEADTPGILSKRQRKRLPSQSVRPSRKRLNFPLLITAAAAAVLVLMFAVQSFLDNPMGPALAENSAPPAAAEPPPAPVQAQPEPVLEDAVTVTTRKRDPSRAMRRNVQTLSGAPAIEAPAPAPVAEVATNPPVLAPIDMRVTSPEIFEEVVTFAPDALRPDWGTLGGLGPVLADASEVQPSPGGNKKETLPTIVASRFATTETAAAGLPSLDAGESDLLSPDNDAALALGVRQRPVGEPASGAIVAVVPQLVPSPVPDLEVAAASKVRNVATGESAAWAAAINAGVHEGRLQSLAASTVTNRANLNRTQVRLAPTELTPALKGQAVRVNYNVVESDLRGGEPSESLLRLYANAGAAEREAVDAFASSAAGAPTSEIPLQRVPEVIRSMQQQGIPVRLGPVEVQGTVLDVLPGFIHVNLELEGLEQPVPVQLPLAQVVWVDATPPPVGKATTIASDAHAENTQEPPAQAEPTETETPASSPAQAVPAH